MATAFPDRSHGSSRSLSLHPLHVTPKPYRVHPHPDHHSRSLLAQFGLTPKSKRGLGAGEVVDVSLWNWSQLRRAGQGRLTRREYGRRGTRLYQSGPGRLAEFRGNM